MLEMLRQLAAYNAWANAGLVLAMRAVPDLEAMKLPVLRHLLVSEATWLARLKGKGSTIALWEPGSLEECMRFAREARETLTAYVAGLSASDPERTITYTNTQGIAFQNTITEILMHMLLHSARHRGEVAAALGDHGLEAPEIDLSGYLRAGSPEPAL